MTDRIRRLVARAAIAIVGCATVWSSAFAATQAINLAESQTGSAETETKSGPSTDTSLHSNAVEKASFRNTVQSMQRALNKDGADLNVDGVMGPETTTALLNYQSRHDLPITGWLDTPTKVKLHII